MIRSLVSGKEFDSEEVGRILSAAGKTEDDFDRDTETQVMRFAKAAERERNLQAIVDRQQAEKALQKAKAELQAAYNKIQPSIDQAHERLAAANLVYSCTMDAEAWLSDPANILDQELLQREAALIPELQTINSELKPLVADHGRLQTALENAEFQHTQKTRSTGRVAWFVQAKDADELAEIVANLQSQLRQLNALIHPRQRRQRELQAELNSIHQQKLQP
jgi:hypothetical protein